MKCFVGGAFVCSVDRYGAASRLQNRQQRSPFLSDSRFHVELITVVVASYVR